MKTIKILLPQNNIINTSQLPQTEEWLPEGLYKDWFSFKIDGYKIKKFDTLNNEWGLKSFQKNYMLRDATKHKFTDSITVKTTYIALTPVGEKNKSYAAGLWKIESIE